MSRQGSKRQTCGYHRTRRKARDCENRQSWRTSVIFTACVLVFGLFAEAAADIPVAKKDGTWMVDIDSLSKSEGLTTTLQPVERRFKAKGKDFNCSFVLGFSYIFANGKAVKLDAVTTYENDVIWAPVKEAAEIFSTAFSKNYVLDTAAGLLKTPAVSAPAAATKNVTTENVKPESATKASENTKAAESTKVAEPTKKSEKTTAAAETKVADKKQPVRSNKNAPAGSREVKNIVIDPGHGGKDPGAIGLFSNEKDIVLAVGKKLQKELEAMGFNVKLTRSNDIFIQLSERPQIANKWNGDLFISLHCNAIDGNKERKKKTKGFRIYVLRDPESEEDRAIARRENKVAKTYGDKNSKDELSPLDWLKIQARLEQYKQASYTFTEKTIKAYASDKIPKQGSGAGGAGFMVLVGAFMPATLIELGFISNPDEEKYMNSEKGQKNMAKRIAKGVEDYKEAIDDYLRTLSR